MPVTYYDLGAGRRLHELVFAGTHDSGITGGGRNARTQTDGIHGQAVAGARIFDLRVAGHGTGSVQGNKTVTLQTYHADPSLQKHEAKTRSLHRTGVQHDLTRTKLKGGAWGDSLSAILDEARRYVEQTEPTEFLLLKFDKCQNWSLIADACMARLGPVLYTGGGNINTRTLQDLAGSVVVLFSRTGLQAMGGARPGIMGFVNLNGVDTPGAQYDPQFDGLQYLGKGGTSAMNGKFDRGKMDDNIRKQTGIIRQLSGSVHGSAPEVLGMIYWTSTGFLRSIRKRDDYMWRQRGGNRSRLTDLWTGGLEEAITARLPQHLDPTQYAASGQLKVFMPNFVMVDFMDDVKGQFIKDLNDVAAVSLTLQALAQRAQQAN